jgi:hypothetical protein
MGPGASMSSTMYEFRVDGRLSEHSRDAFCGMLVEEIPPGLVLRGAVIDEPHLLGIIDQLRVLGLSLVSVRPVARPGHAARRSAGTSAPTTGARRVARRLARRTGNRRDDRG